jgi:hypothetical protein
MLQVAPAQHLGLVTGRPTGNHVTTTFSIVMTVFEPFELLPRAMMNVCRQEYADWELLLVVDGPAPKGRFSPKTAADQLRRHFPGKRIDIWELPRAEGCYGNAGRRFALDHAGSDYVCWVNHDNLIAPRYLAAHAANIEKTPGCLSVVDVDLWVGDRYHGVYPRRFARSKIDLLCFAIPLATAREVDAFGGTAAKVYAADWITFAACQKLLPIEHYHGVVGTHF